MIISPVEDTEDVEVVRGPNIKPFPLNTLLEDNISGKVVLKVQDNITTDHIMPSNAKLLPFRSNIPYLSEYCFNTVDEEFPKRAKENNGGFIVGGENYGQGSSREHAALAPLYLGIKAVLAKSFARIHKANLINSGIIPMVFDNENDYNNIDLNDDFEINNLYEDLKKGKVKITNTTKGEDFYVKVELSPYEIEVIKAGGKLNYTKNKLKK